MSVFYARWYSGIAPAVFRLHYDEETQRVTAAEAWVGDSWEPIDWDVIGPWLEPIMKEELPAGVTP